MNQIPNIITSIRFLAAAALLWNCLFSIDHGAGSFLVLFVAAGVSDMLDGHVARTNNWCTEFGAKFDSVSDLFLYIAASTFLWLNAPEQLGTVRNLLAIGACTQLFHLTLAFVKHRQFPAYHSTFSRVCAYFIFFGICGFWISKSSAIFPALALAWTICSIEGIIMTCILKKPVSNLSGIAAAIKANQNSAKTEAAITREALTQAQ